MLTHVIASRLVSHSRTQDLRMEDLVESDSIHTCHVINGVVRWLYDSTR